MDFKKAIAFLSKLKKNNHKDWFDANRKEWEEIRTEFTGFVTECLSDLSIFDKNIEGIEAKDCIFRINKDIRFSKDKTPYKTNIGAGISKDGRKSNYAGYYIHFEPDNCFIAGGLYAPDPADTKAVRQEIDYNWKEFNSIINEKSFKKNFGKLQGDKLVNLPKGYDAENPAAEYLKYKSYIVVHQIPQQDIYKGDFKKQLILICKSMKPFTDFLNQAIGNK